MATSTHQAIVNRTIGGKLQLIKESVPKPEPESHQALVKLSHVAQNPTDIQSFDGNAFGDGAVLGCDFTGRVEKIGSDVNRLSEGDVIAGLIWGGEIKGLGAYSEYSIADEKICFKVPKGSSPEEASTVPLASATAWLALFSKDCLDIDQRSKASVLIWGGSSSVGLYAIQIAALANLDIVTTCSPKNFDLVKSYGAKYIFDYNDTDIVKKIQQAAPGLSYVFDTIGNETSSATGSQAINEKGGVLCTVRPGKAFTKNVSKQTKVTDVLVWTAFNKDHQYKDFKWPANQDDHDLAFEFFEKLPGWLESGKIKPSKTKVLNGLDAVKDGFQEHRDRKISAYKIVYKV